MPNLGNGVLAVRELATFATKLTPERGSAQLDWSGCRYFPAQFVAVLDGLLARSGLTSEQVAMIGLHPKVEQILRRNAYLLPYGFPALDDGYGTTIPSRRYTLDEHRRFAADVRTEYIGRVEFPSVSDGVAYRLTQSLLEVYVNARMHSASAHGVFVCGQSFRQRQRLALVVYDCGLGIPSSVRSFLPERLDDVDAITWAMTSGNTTKASSGGLGLALLEEFIKLNSGQLAVVSGRGAYLVESGKARSAQLADPLPGTCISVSVRTNDNNVYTMEEESHGRDIF